MGARCEVEDQAWALKFGDGCGISGKVSSRSLLGRRIGLTLLIGYVIALGALR